ncbi:hypothetical protein STEG23_021309, partial [Scotinomys teguina]
MSRSQLEQEKKPLDSFYWLNEITGEVTLPPGEETTFAASGEKHRARARSGSGRGSTLSSVAAAAHRSVSPVNPEAVGKDRGAGNLFPPDSAMPCILSPEGGALPVQRHLGASPPPAK